MKRQVCIGVFACLLVAAAQPGVWMRLQNGYAGDDFWTLGGPERIGLLAIALSLSLLALLASAAVSEILKRRIAHRAIALVSDLSIKTTAFIALHTASPELFYLYYRTIFSGLPAQSVIRWPDPKVWTQLLSLSADARLAEHVAGALFWGVLLASAWRHLNRGRPSMAAAAIFCAAPWVATLLA